MFANVMDTFNGFDTFTKMFVVVAILVAIAIPVVVNNQQTIQQEAATPQVQKIYTISLNQSDTPPALGTYVTFTVNMAKNVNNPRVEVKCFLDAAKTNLVYGEA